MRRALPARIARGPAALRATPLPAPQITRESGARCAGRACPSGGGPARPLRALPATWDPSRSRPPRPAPPRPAAARGARPLPKLRPGPRRPPHGYLAALPRPARGHAASKDQLRRRRRVTELKMRLLPRPPRTPLPPIGRRRRTGHQSPWARPPPRRRASRTQTGHWFEPFSCAFRAPQFRAAVGVGT